MLQFEHSAGQLLNRHRASVAKMADIEVLAEDATQVASGEEYRAGAAGGTGFQPVKTRPSPLGPLRGWPCHQDAFLAEVRADGADEGHISDPAEAELPPAAIDLTLPRTERAGVHTLPQPADRLAERTEIDRQRPHNAESLYGEARNWQFRGVLRAGHECYKVRSGGFSDNQVF